MNQLLRQFSIRLRLTAGLAALGILMLVVVLWSVWTVRSVREQGDQLMAQQLQSLDTANGVLFSMERMQRLEQATMLNGSNTVDRKSTRLNSSHSDRSRMPSSA